MDRLGSIVAFVRTADTGSFARAGELLGMHGSAVSKRVQKLEEYVGVRLLLRNTRALSLTDKGRAFHARCSQILKDLEDAEITMSNRAMRLHGRLIVSLPVALGRLHIVPVLSDFMREHTELELVTMLNDQYVDLVGGGYDLAIRIGELQDSSLIGRRLTTINYIVCASPNYIAEMGMPKHPSDLAKHRCITFVPAPGSKPAPWRFMGSDAGTSVDLPVNGPLRFNNAEALLDGAIRGAGCAQLHSYIAAPAIAAGLVRPVLQDFAAPGPGVYVLYPSGRQLSPKVRAFIGVITDLFTPCPIWER